MNYEFASSFAQTSGLLYFVGMFCAVLLYALWPRNRARFDAASRMPLTEE
ncbi:cbb3-type cytochrome c oxidase subunit 3 [Enterovirga sp. CN4-39]